MVEVYNEAVYDLLASPDEGHQKLQLQNKGKNVAVPVSIVHAFVYVIEHSYCLDAISFEVSITCSKRTFIFEQLRQLSLEDLYMPHYSFIIVFYVLCIII